MASLMRWRYGDTAPVMVPVAAETVIEIGDLVYLVGGQAQPAAAQADTGTKAGNQEAFHDKFLGVSQQRSLAGDTANIRVATRGVFEFNCPSDALTLGQLVGPSENSSGNALLNQQLETVATANLAVGRLVSVKADGNTTLYVEIVGSVSHGGPQAIA